MLRPQNNKSSTGRKRWPEKGFTLVEVLTVSLMIAILSTMAVVSMRGGRRIAFETKAIAAMKNIAENEIIFYQRHGAYGSWDEMVAELDLIDPGYDKIDILSDPSDAPMANLYSIAFSITATGQSFTAVAFPKENETWHLRTYAVTSDGSILNSKENGSFFSTLYFAP